MAKIENSRRGQAVRLYLLLVTSQKDTAAILNAKLRLKPMPALAIAAKCRALRKARAAGNAQQNPNWNDILMI